MFHLSRAILVLAIAGGLAGCGASQQAEVQAKVEQFAHATAAKDDATLCQQVLAPSLVQRLAGAGLTCRQAMRVFLASVQNPTLSVGRITVKGNRATAAVLAGASGQRAALASLGLVQTSHGWRVVSLTGPH